MKRFTNILILYDFEAGADEALECGINLAIRNQGKLTVLHVIEGEDHTIDQQGERRKMLNRLCANIRLDGNKLDVLVLLGDKAEEAQAYINRHQVDLVIMPSESGRGFDKLIGKDTAAELLRDGNCPIWVVRGSGRHFYRSIVVAVNAGKENALSCPINKRLLEMGASLAEMEHAELKVLYIWDYEQKDRDRLSSELTDDMRQTIYENAHYDALGALIKLMVRVLGEPIKGKPAVRQGDVEDEIYRYIEEEGADVLISEGMPTTPLRDAVIGNRGLRLLNNVQCSVLVSRPS